MCALAENNCLFFQDTDDCTNEFTAEHIIQQSLGGTLSSPQLICASCNNFFSNNLDKAINDFYKNLYIILSPLLPGRRRAIEGETLDGVPLMIESGGVASVKKIKKKYNANGDLSEIIAPPSVSKKKLETIASKTVRLSSQSKFVRTPLADLCEYQNMPLGIDDLFIRAVCLDLIEFIRYGTLKKKFPDFARHTALRGLRNFVRHGYSTSAFRMRGLPIAWIADLLERLFAPSTFSHKLVASYNPRDSSLILAAQFFDTMPFALVLESLSVDSRPVSLLYKKALLDGKDQFFVENKAVLDPKMIALRLFSASKEEYAIRFKKTKFFNSWREQRERAIYELDMRSDDELLNTLSIRVGNSTDNNPYPQVRAIVDVVAIRYSEHPSLSKIREETYQRALCAWKNTTVDSTKKMMLDVYRQCLHSVKQDYGLPRSHREN